MNKKQREQRRHAKSVDQARRHEMKTKQIVDTTAVVVDEKTENTEVKKLKLFARISLAFRNAYSRTRSFLSRCWDWTKGKAHSFWGFISKPFVVLGSKLKGLKKSVNSDAYDNMAKLAPAPAVVTA